MKRILSLILCLTLMQALAVSVIADAPAELTATAEVEQIKKYGNIPLSLTNAEIKTAGYQYGDIVTVSFLEQSLDLPLCSNYSDVDSGSPGIFAREEDTNVVLAINMGDFATTYGIAVKTTHEDKTFTWSWAEGVERPVQFHIRMKQPGGYRDEYMLHQLSYTDERADYTDLSDEEFANFRAVDTAGMGSGVLYRTCSPINPEHKRNTFADAALKAAGVTVVMNLADDEATASGYEGFDQSYYATTDFIALSMGMDFTTAEFQTKLADGLRYFSEHPGIYAVHCNEGKDRTGFVMALLECLMGASYEEVIADYMSTYDNYYGVKADDPRYDVICSSNIVKTLSNAFGISDLKAADLTAGAEGYLKQIGLADETVAALKKNLSATPEAVTPEPMPAPEPTEDTTYVVAAGDCLWKLAKRFYGRGLDWTRLAEANGLRAPYVVYIGQSLRIPA